MYTLDIQSWKINFLKCQIHSRKQLRRTRILIHCKLEHKCCKCQYFPTRWTLDFDIGHTRWNYYPRQSRNTCEFLHRFRRSSSHVPKNSHTFPVRQCFHPPTHFQSIEICREIVFLACSSYINLKKVNIYTGYIYIYIYV